MVSWPALLTTRRGEVRERAVRARREPGGGKRRAQAYLPNRLLHLSDHEKRPVRFFTNHYPLTTNHCLFSRASTVGW